MNRAARLLLIVFGTMCMAGCDSGTKWKSGKYKVYWIDVPKDLMLGLDLGDGDVIGRVMSQVFAVGENDKWIVVARYPDGDQTKEEFFYFPKAKDHPHKNGDEIVLGPFTKAAFEKLKSDLGLPEWSKRF